MSENQVPSSESEPHHTAAVIPQQHRQTSGLTSSQAVESTATTERENRYRPTPKEYWIRYGELAQRDGEKCWRCGRGPQQGIKLEIDHIDGKISTWVLENQKLACKPDNVRFQRQTATSARERRTQPEVRSRNISWEASRSLELGPTFDKELRRLLDEAGSTFAGPNYWIPTVKNVENRLAEICGCDQQTVTRWIERKTTPEGDYELSERTVVIDGRKKRTAQIIGLKSQRNE